MQIYNGEQALSTSDYHGSSNYSCGDYGSCVLTGATLTFEFSADAFSDDAASVRVDPPEGDRVTADFDLVRLR